MKYINHMRARLSDVQCELDERLHGERPAFNRFVEDSGLPPIVTGCQ